MPNITLEPVTVAFPPDEARGVLVYDGGALVAVAVRLSEANAGGALDGRWSIEAGFDHLACLPDETFDDLDELTRWIEHRRARARVAGSGRAGSPPVPRGEPGVGPDGDDAA